MAFSQAKLDEVKAAAAAAGPCVIEKIQAYNKWKAPEFFSCKSGVLLWGQLPTIMQGYLEEELDTPNGPYHRINNGGTILMHCFRYRAPARKGLWKVEAIFTGKPDRPIGYVCHHVDADGPDLLRRAALVGISYDNDHLDHDIVYVNRYDWSRHGCPQAGYQLMKGIIRKAGLRRNAYEDYEEALIMNRFMLVDEQGFPRLVQSLRNGFKLDAKNFLFKDNKNGNNVKSAGATATPLSQDPSDSSDAFGVNLGIGDKDNELGWMAFQNGELVGFVYDGAYCELTGTSFEYGDTKVEVEREPEPEFNDEFDLGDWAAWKRTRTQEDQFSYVVIVVHLTELDYAVIIVAEVATLLKIVQAMATLPKIVPILLERGKNEKQNHIVSVLSKWGRRQNHKTESRKSDIVTIVTRLVMQGMLVLPCILLAIVTSLVIHKMRVLTCILS